MWNQRFTILMFHSAFFFDYGTCQSEALDNRHFSSFVPFRFAVNHVLADKKLIMKHCQSSDSIFLENLFMKVNWVVILL
jgi:hypothetical protein